MYPIEVNLASFSFSNSSIISFVRFCSSSNCLNSSFRMSLVTVLLERIEPVVALAMVSERRFVWLAGRVAVERRVLDGLEQVL